MKTRNSPFVNFLWITGLVLWIFLGATVVYLHDNGPVSPRAFALTWASTVGVMLVLASAAHFRARNEREEEIRQKKHAKIMQEEYTNLTKQIKEGYKK